MRAVEKACSSDVIAGRLAAVIVKAMPDAHRELKSKSSYLAYQDDPVGFCEDILHETLTDDVKQMMESVRDNQITVAVSANATGKTHGGARIATWFYKCHPNCKVFTAAAPPLENLKNLLWGEIGSVIVQNPDLFKSDTITTMDIRRGPEDFLTGVTIPSSGTAQEREAKFSGKHQEHMLFVLDEGDAIPDDVYKGIESCMSGGLKVRLLIFLNPRLASGAVFRMQRDHTANVVHLSAFRHPNVIEGRDVIPGAVTRETTIRRINQWCRALAKGEVSDGSCFDLPAYLTGSIAKSQGGEDYPPLQPGSYKIMDPAFSYMVLGQYPAQGSQQLISREWIAAARSRWDVYVSRYGEIPPVGTYSIAGLDVGEFGTDSNVLCFRYGGFVEKMVPWSGLDTMATADRAVSEYQLRKVSIANVDATGVGAGVAPAMQRRGCSAIPVKVASSPNQRTEQGEFKILRDQLWWACREWLRTDQGAMLPPDEMLIEELQAGTYEVARGKIRVMKKDTMREVLKRSPDRADALCLTFHSGGFFAGLDFS